MSEKVPTKTEGAGGAIKIDSQTVRELVGMAGAALAGYGAWLSYPPAGFMVGGAILVILAVLGTLRGGN